MAKIRIDEDYTIQWVSNERILSLEQLMEASGIKKEFWEVLWQEANKWDCSKANKDGSWSTVENYQIKAKFKPITQLAIPQYMDELKKLFVPPVLKDRPVYKDWPLLSQIIHSDTHFDRIEHKWKNYLKEIDDRTFRLFELLLKHKPDKLIYVNLWDYWNSDGEQKTSKWTPQHNLYSEKESFRIWLEHQRNLISQLSSEIPVDVIYVSWNHDENKMQALADSMDLYFWATNNVSINREPEPRKYIKRWDNTIGYQHWHWTKPKQLSATMNAEAGLKKNNYMFQGHIHQDKREEIWWILLETVPSTAYPSERERGNWWTTRGAIKWALFDKKKWKIASFSQ